MTKQQIEQYNLTPIANNWFVSQQGLVFVDGDCERAYLSKVFKMNEIDSKHKELILKYPSKPIKTSFGGQRRHLQQAPKEMPPKKE
jgi:hypothetical protein